MEKIIPYVGAILGGGLAISFIVFFSAYKSALKMHEQLTQVYNHPNARVASGEQAKKVLAAVDEHKKSGNINQEKESYGLVVKQSSEP